MMSFCFYYLHIELNGADCPFHRWHNERSIKNAKHSIKNVNKLNEVIVLPGWYAHIGQSLQDRFELAVSDKSKAISTALKLIC